MQSGNKNFMQTIFKVSIQPASYLVNCYLSIQSILIKFSKLYCNHMKQKLCHLLFTLANVNAPINVDPPGGGSGICGVFDHQLHPHPGDFD